MAKIRCLEDIEVWKKARALCKAIHSLTKEIEFSKDFKLKNQILSSSGSIMDNIAEGFGRNSSKEFIQFLMIANASAMETKSQLYRAFDFNYINEATLLNLQSDISEISRMIFSLFRYLKESPIKGQKNKFDDVANTSL